jgi:hypothetical protein
MYAKQTSQASAYLPIVTSYLEVSAERSANELLIYMRRTMYRVVSSTDGAKSDSCPNIWPKGRR